MSEKFGILFALELKRGLIHARFVLFLEKEQHELRFEKIKELRISEISVLFKLVVNLKNKGRNN